MCVCVDIFITNLQLQLYTCRLQPLYKEVHVLVLFPQIASFDALIKVADQRTGIAKCLDVISRLDYLHDDQVQAHVYNGSVQVQCAPALCHSCVTQGRKSVPLRSFSPVWWE